MPTTLGILPLLPLLGLLLGGGAIATGAVVASNLSEDPRIVYNTQGNLDQTNQESFLGINSNVAPWLLVVVTGGLIFWYLKRKKK